MGKGAPGVRYAEVDRETAETRVQAVLDLDGGTKQDVSTGIPFFDRMLAVFASNAEFDIGVKAEGDVQADEHHIVEDVGIVLGRALREALRDSESIVRCASNHVCMDEALVHTTVDISGRGLLFFDVPFTREKIGTLSTETVREFFRAFTHNAGMTAHIRVLGGVNDHHICEAVFKGFGRSLLDATHFSDRRALMPNKAVTT